jgi:hypothetical protein
LHAADVDRLKPEHGHHCIFVNPDQVERLLCLAETANLILKRLKAISIVDLLYAALWRQLSTARFFGPATALAVIESTEKNMAEGDRGALNVLHHTLISTVDYLDSQSLVDVAQRIRCSLQEGCEDSQFEGWLVDSLGSNAFSPRELADFNGLVCSSLPLPFLLSLVHKSLLGPLSSYQGEPRDDEISLSSGADTCQRLATLDSNRVNLSARIFCINMSGNNFGRIADATNSSGIPHSVISIDMWLPLAEINRFKSLYGDCCFVGDSFFDN